jgi:FAD/FMN-containing dehydrogenase
VWTSIPSVVSDSLSQGLKKAYDPHNILNPGILGN